MDVMQYARKTKRLSPGAASAKLDTPNIVTFAFRFARMGKNEVGTIKNAAAETGWSRKTVGAYANPILFCLMGSVRKGYPRVTKVTAATKIQLQAIIGVSIGQMCQNALLVRHVSHQLKDMIA
eukprot:Plantae.Rhodophyta-Palmaria_palmata.ctg7447.p2 GENE.Plantae.Rhodophyta-Palmaria_palmata.ctg7447~~Plantae.Rhodophyta-Palmaria_palmata.ctg7447.p2  ORF type:complete len:123 (-),score=1.00 Plantae.Rhodophyta-Palmaria_palmata.ctg7447:106-474(-)